MGELGFTLMFVLLGLLSGGILFSYHLPLWFAHVDITKCSKDHNPGTANAMQYAGVPVGFLCLLLDMAKGCVVVALAMRFVDFHTWPFALVLASPVFGHAWAPFYHISGGKGIAVSFGVLLSLVPRSYLIFLLAVLYVFFSVILVIQPNERRTVFSFAFFAVGAVSMAPFTGSGAIALGCCLISGIVIWKNWAVPPQKEHMHSARARV